jgi:hypothetical protein
MKRRIQILCLLVITTLYIGCENEALGPTGINYVGFESRTYDFDVGFNNKVTFNKAFKAEMKMTPSVFLKETYKKRQK